MTTFRYIENACMALPNWLYYSKQTNFTFCFCSDCHSWCQYWRQPCHLYVNKRNKNKTRKNGTKCTTALCTLHIAYRADVTAYTMQKFWFACYLWDTDYRPNILMAIIQVEHFTVQYIQIAIANRTQSSVTWMIAMLILHVHVIHVN